MSPELIDQCIEALYASVTAPAELPSALASVATLFDATGATYLRTGTGGVLLDAADYGRDASVLDLFVRHYNIHDPTRPLLIASRPCEWFEDDRVLDPGSASAGEYVHDFAWRAGIRWFRGGKIFEDARGAAFISVQRPADAKPFGREATHLLDCLRPHLARMARMREQLSKTIFATQALQATTDALSASVFIVDAECRVT